MKPLMLDRVAAMNISYQFYSMNYFLESVAKIGFHRIDLWTGYPHMVLDNDYEAQCQALRSRCDALGLSVDNITPKVIGMPLNIADRDPKIRAQAIAYIKRAIDASQILGAKTLQLVPGTGLHDESVGEAWKRSRDSLAELADYAVQSDRILALEAIQIVESNLVGDSCTLKKMIDEVNSPALGAVVDTTHMTVNGETLRSYFDLMNGRIFRVHLNETNQLPWGEGHAPIQVYLQQLRSYEYSGPMTVEICSKPHYLKPHTSMQNTYDYLLDAFNRQQ